MAPTQGNTLEITAFDWVPEFARGNVRDLRARWACEEAGLPYKTRLISAMNRPEWFYDEQPWGQVPVIRDGDIGVFESGAILVYIAEKTGRLMPAGGQGKASVMSWLFGAFNSIEPLVFELANIDVFSKGEKWAELRRPGAMAALAKRLDRMAKALGDNEWLAGDFSIADIAMATVLRETGISGALDECPTLSAYRDRALARPAFAKALDAQLADFKADTEAGA